MCYPFLAYGEGFGDGDGGGGCVGPGPGNGVVGGIGAGGGGPGCGFGNVGPGLGFGGSIATTGATQVTARLPPKIPASNSTKPRTIGVFSFTLPDRSRPPGQCLLALAARAAKRPRAPFRSVDGPGSV